MDPSRMGGVAVRDAVLLALQGEEFSTVPPEGGPGSRKHRPPGPRPGTEGGRPARYRTPRVLVVDDYPDTRAILTEVLVNGGFRVETAEDGYEALDKAGSWGPDVVILDLLLPRIDGFGVAERLKKRATTSRVPIVAYTALTDPEHLTRAERVGCAAVLIKPTPSADLIASLRGLLPPDTRLATGGPDPQPDDTWVRLSDLRRIYQATLPGRVDRLTAAWRELRDSERPDPVRLDALSTELERLASSASMYGFPELSRSAVGSNEALLAWRSRPDEDGLELVDRRLDDLRQEARRWGSMRPGQAPA